MKTPNTPIHVYVIIVNWNGYPDTRTCIQSLLACKQTKGKLHIVVVDNGSKDNSAARLTKEFSGITVIPLPENTGFTGGNNSGITYALNNGAEIIWLLNNDTIVHPDVLSFLDVFKNQHVGACGNKIYFASGHEYHRDRYSDSERGTVIWYAGGIMDWANVYASHRGVDEVDKGQYETVTETQFITGCSFAVRSSVLRSVGLLDEKYFLYLEDLDLSIRIQKAGWKTVYTPHSVVWHINAGSSGKPGNPLHEYYFTRNRLLLGMRYAPVRTRIALLRQAMGYVIFGSRIRRKAVLDALSGRYGKQYEPKTNH